MLATVVVLVLPASALGATIDVGIRTDEFMNNADCSLREAVDAANQDTLAMQVENSCTPGNGADTITLHAGADYTLTTIIDGVPDINDGDLELTDPDGVTVLGEGRATTRVDGDGAFNDRIFELTAGAGGLTLNSATVHNGIVALAAGGGGILSAGGDVSLIAAGVTENQQTSAMGGGGGIALNDEAALTASGDTAINDNISAGLGGGIYKLDDGDVTLNQGVAINGNDAVGRGGGIYGLGTNTALTLNGASASNNDLAENASSIAIGSAIHYGATSAFSFTGAQISGNDAVADGAIAALELGSDSASAITGSTISGNTETGQDDGDADLVGTAVRLNVSGGTTISNSTISQNVTNNVDPQDSTNGSGLYALGPLTITGSTFALNSVMGVANGTRGAGALYIENSAFTTARILNSTFTGNSAPDYGGAINLQAGGQLTIGQSTFSGNISNQGPAINAQGNPLSSITLRGTIFDDGPGACSNLSNVGTVNANSFNVDAGTSCVDQPDMPPDTDFEDTDAQLGMLVDNGGPTQTMRLLGPANLFNAAGACKQLDGVTNLTVDQRGFPRPSEGACEPGAYERFICNGVELMQPGPFPGCTAQGGPATGTPTPAPGTSTRRCPPGFKLKTIKKKGKKPKRKCVRKKRKKR